jgi:hypothetical protein
MELRMNARYNRWSCQWPRMCDDSSKEICSGSPKERAWQWDLSTTAPRESDFGRDYSSRCIEGNHIAPYPLPTRISSSERLPLPSKSSVALLLGPASVRGKLFPGLDIALNDTLITKKASINGGEPMVSNWCQYSYAVCPRRLPFLELGARSTFKAAERKNMIKVEIIARPSYATVWPFGSCRYTNIVTTLPKLSDKSCFHVLFRMQRQFLQLRIHPIP